jgi:undecaprenyl-diphosphatase
MDFDYGHALVLGLVEGLTEFLPISSTGHLMLAGHLLGIEKSEFFKTFEVAIQPGAILAVVLLYWRALLVNWRVMLRLAVAFVPTVVIGLLVHDWVRDMLESIHVVLASFLLGGIVIIVLERLHRERPGEPERMEEMSLLQAFLIGVCQTLAFVPGVSRSAATILGGLAVGVRRKAAVEFSFLLAVPTLGAATVLFLYKFHKQQGHFTTEQGQLLAVGFVVSFVAALLTIQLILRYIKTHTFAPFGVYRIVVALGFWLWLWLAG